MDYAKEEHRDVSLVRELLRYCEDQFVVWARSPFGYRKKPHIAPHAIEKMHGQPSAYTGGLIALAFKRLHEITGNELDREKARALMDGILTVQDPVTGGIHDELGPTVHTFTSPSDALYYTALPAMELAEYSGVTETRTITPKRRTMSAGHRLTRFQVRHGIGTGIGFSLDAPETVRLTVYDVRGRMIEMPIDGKRSAGHHELLWRSESSGAYVFKLELGTKHYTLRAMMF
jgi:hypothetical protein